MTQGEQGWYRSSRIQLIKAVLRHKYTHLLLSGLPAPLEECEEIINASLAADDGGDGGGSDGDEDEEGGKDARSMASKRDPFAKTRLAAAEGGTGLGGVGLSVRPHLSMRRRAGNLRVGGGAGGAPEVGEEEAVVSGCALTLHLASSSSDLLTATFYSLARPLDSVDSLPKRNPQQTKPRLSIGEGAYDTYENQDIHDDRFTRYGSLQRHETDRRPTQWL
jgi:hypothetical protein